MARRKRKNSKKVKKKYLPDDETPDSDNRSLKNGNLSDLSSYSDLPRKKNTRSKCCRKCRKKREKRLMKKLKRVSHSSNNRRRRSKSSSDRSEWWKNFRGSRSPSIPIDPNRTSPSHLELRRITSARKLPVPYNRNWSSSSDYTDSDDSYYSDIERKNFDDKYNNSKR